MSAPQRVTTRVTAVEVAALAGVSIASVSRVLNGLGSSQEMSDRVHLAAAELGYVADATARSLKVGRTEQLALAVGDVTNPAYVPMMRAVDRVARAAGYRTVLAAMGTDVEDEIEVLRNLARGYADGLIFNPLRITPALIREVEAARCPVVIVGSVATKIGIDTVRADSPGAVRLALEHLHETGRRRVAFLNGPVDTVPGSGRRRGFQTHARRLGLPLDPSLVVAAEAFTYEAGRAVVDQLLDVAEPPDAVLGANDQLAIAALHAVTDRGGTVPHDVAVVGMDDTELGALSRPALSSVSLGSAERGQAAAELLLARIDDPTRGIRRLTVTPTLVIRESSAPR